MRIILIPCTQGLCNLDNNIVLYNMCQRARTCAESPADRNRRFARRRLVYIVSFQLCALLARYSRFSDVGVGVLMPFGM